MHYLDLEETRKTAYLMQVYFPQRLRELGEESDIISVSTVPSIRHNEHYRIYVKSGKILEIPLSQNDLFDVFLGEEYQQFRLRKIMEDKEEGKRAKD